MVVDFFFFQAEDGIRELVRSRGLGDVYKRQVIDAAVKGCLALEEFLDGRPNTLYLCAPPEDQKKFGGLFISVMRYLMRLATRKNWGFKPWTDSAPPCPLLVMLDEAGNIAPFEAVSYTHLTLPTSDLV